MQNMRTNLSNTTKSQLDARKQEIDKQRKCEHCGADRDKVIRMHHFEQSIIECLRDQQLVKRDSCIQCVQKHIGKAMVLYKELLTAEETNNVNVHLNHLEVIGNLQAAMDEAQEWPALHDAIDIAEREYRYKGTGPDWEVLAKFTQDVCELLQRNKHLQSIDAIAVQSSDS